MTEDDENTANDALLAAMLQNEIDTERMAEEKHRNGNAKVTMSSFRGTQYRDPEEFSEDEEESFYGESVLSLFSFTDFQNVIHNNRFLAIALKTFVRFNFVNKKTVRPYFLLIFKTGL